MRKTLLHLVAVLAIVALMAGCGTLAKVHYETNTTDPSTGATDQVVYDAVAKAGMFGQLESANQNFGFDEGSLQVGQAATGLDNSGQVVVAQIAASVATEMTKAFAPIIAAAQAGTSLPSDTGETAGLCEELCGLSPAIINAMPALKAARDRCGCK